MKTVTAKEVKNRLGQVLDAAQVEPVEITKNGRTFAFMLSAKQYWDLVGCNLSFDDKFFIVAGVANGEIELKEAMSRLRVSSKNEFDELSRSFGVGVKDEILKEKNERKEKFYMAVKSGEAQAFDAHAFAGISRQCKVLINEK